MTTPYENFVNIALGKSLSADVTLPTADDIPVFTGIGRQVTGKTKAELGLALTADLDTDGTLAANSDTKYPSQKAVKTYADTKQAALGDVITANTYGSSTQYPIVTVNAKGIVTGITLQTAGSIAPPAYTASVPYVAGQLVTHQGHVWKILINHTGAIPFVNGNLELQGSVFSVIPTTATYACQQLGSTALVDKVYDITLGDRLTPSVINLGKAPRIVRIHNVSADIEVGATNISVSLSRTGADVFTDSVAGSQVGPYVVTIPAGSTLLLYNYNTYTYVCLSQLNIAGSFKLMDAATLGTTSNKGWKFSGTASGAHTFTMPAADVNLGKLTNSTVVPSGITVTASPFTYQNTTAFNGDVIISGGTVSDIEFTRDNTTFYTVGFIEGVLRLSPSDRVRVTYTVAPTMTYVPR